MRRNLFGLFERRSLESPAVPLTSSGLLEFLGGGGMTDAGVPVTERSSLHMPAVWRAVNVIAGVSSALPLHTYSASTRERTTSPLLANPHPELTSLELWRLAYAHRALWGNSYQQKIRNGAGQVVELWPIGPDRVQVEREKPTPEDPGGKVFWVTDDWGTVHRRTSRDILHIPGLGYDGVTGCSPVRLAAAGIGLAQAAEKSAARLFGSGNMIGGVLQTEQRLNPEQAAALKERWKAKMAGIQNAHEVAVLDSGASFQPVAMPLKDSQFLESREFQVVEVARMFGVPLFLLMETAKSTSWGTGLEQQATGWVKFDLSPRGWPRPSSGSPRSSWPPARRTRGTPCRGCSAATRRPGRRSTGLCGTSARCPPTTSGARGSAADRAEGDIYLQPTYMAPLGSNPLADEQPPDGGSNTARAAA